MKYDDFFRFEVNDLMQVRGGMLSGTVDGSQISSGGYTYVDVSWEDGTSSCNKPLQCGDGGSDTFVGDTIVAPTAEE